jgi:hypothetical protein
MSVEWSREPEQCQALWDTVCRWCDRMAVGTVIWWVILLAFFEGGDL